MPVPEETRRRLSQWCAARVPVAERDRRQIGYTIQGDEVTILDRRPPIYPELEMEWSTQPVAQLRLENSRTERWVLYRRQDGGSDGEDSGDWEDTGESGTDPIALLDGVLA